MIEEAASSVNASSSSFAPVWALLKKIGVLYSSITHSVCTSFHYKNHLNISWYSLIPQLPLLLCCRKQIENKKNQLLLFFKFPQHIPSPLSPSPLSFSFSNLLLLLLSPYPFLRKITRKTTYEAPLVKARRSVKKTVACGQAVYSMF